MRGIRVALAGNANVGKSVLFNNLTGLRQTCDVAKGNLFASKLRIDASILTQHPFSSMVLQGFFS